MLALLLAGCESIPFLSSTDNGPINYADWERHQKQLTDLEVWTIHGRMVLLADDDGWTATFHWDQDRQKYNLRFIAPLSQGTYELDGDADSVTLLTADNRLYQASGPEVLLEENLGWEIPLTSLKYWIRGLPDPAAPAENLILDAVGRLSDLQQYGWHVSIKRYQVVEGLDLPDKLILENERFQLRLVVQDWQTAT